MTSQASKMLQHIAENGPHKYGCSGFWMTFFGYLSKGGGVYIFTAGYLGDAVTNCLSGK